MIDAGRYEVEGKIWPESCTEAVERIEHELPPIGVHFTIDASRSMEDIEDWTVAFFRYPERITITRYEVHL